MSARIAAGISPTRGRSAARRSWWQSTPMSFSRRLSTCSLIGRDGGLPGNSHGDGTAIGGILACRWSSAARITIDQIMLSDTETTIRFAETAVAFAQSTPPAKGEQHSCAADAPPSRQPRVERVVPILNVSDIRESFAWFAKLGWREGFEWSPDESDARPGFGSVEAGGCEIFLCRDSQGSRGKGADRQTFGRRRRRDRGQGLMDVDLGRQRRRRPPTLRRRGARHHPPPTDEPWGVRECHVRHPDGHVFRISQPL